MGAQAMRAGVNVTLPRIPERGRMLPVRRGSGLLLAGALLLAQPGGPRAQAADLTPGQLQFFENKIRPVLAGQCYECHSAQAKKLKRGLRLDTKAGWQQGGDSGMPAIVPGDVENSPLIRAVRHDDADLAMPPKQPKLSDAVIADLTAWVRMGAPDPRAGVTEPKRADKSWWSLQPLARVEPPAPAGLPRAWARSPIDRFVFDRLAARGLKPNPRAEPRVLIRRLAYDLTGLPPTPEEVSDFERAFRRDPDASVEALVDRLLASPRYGERWGRHWLDVVRFGESRGFERNEIIPNAWPFRDYVIRSLNEDKPFNEFIVEHLAGDVVGKGRPEIEVGVAFLTLGPYDDVGNQDPVAAANIRAATVDDMVAATGAAFLGLTINCARCHYHKFDPVPTEDYYRVKAAFDGVSHASRALSTAEERQRHEATVKPLRERRAVLAGDKAALEKVILDRAKATAPAPGTLRPKASAHLTEEKFAPVPARFVRLTALAQSGNAKSGVGARVDEFEVWAAGPEPRNVALAAAGARASGVTGHEARDFAGAYGIGLVNDGKFSERWFFGSPPVLTIVLPRLETVERVTFSHDRLAMSDTPVDGLGPMLTEYEVHVSSDGTNWQQVADSSGRQPFDEAHARQRHLRRATDEERARMKELDRQIGATDGEIARVPAPAPVWAGSFAQPGAVPVVFQGGDPMKPGDVVPPASLSVLDRVTPAYVQATNAPEAERRLALAKWIVRDDNPLTARVLANRVWQHHFGAGIVDTPSDFGFLGGRPTHPELLDWLARRLQFHGWRLKPLHREIVLSQAWQQSSNWREAGAKADQEARLLWRFPPRRLEAEEARDTMLAVAGKLDLRAGGPGFRLYEYKQDNVATYVPLDRHGPETWRRAVYHQNARASVVDVLSDFDLPDNAFPAPRRSNTTTPLQALTLLNHSFTLDMAAALTERTAREAGPDHAGRIRRAYALALQRAPSAKELAAALKLAESHGLAAFCRALLNANELMRVE
jgi:mono/diheme cytochrome c family protein